MAEKKTAEDAKTNSSVAPKPVEKPKGAAAKKPVAKPKVAAKTASVKKPAATKPARAGKPTTRKTDPVVLTPPKAAKKPAAAEIVDAEVVSVSTAEKTAAGSDAKKSDGIPDRQDGKAALPPASGSGMKYAILGGAAIIVIAIVASVIGRLDGAPPALTAGLTEKVEALQTNTNARLTQLETAVGGLSGGTEGQDLTAVQTGLENLKAALNTSAFETQATLSRSAEDMAALETRLAAAEEKLAVAPVAENSSVASGTETTTQNSGSDAAIQSLRQEIAAQQKSVADLAARLAVLEAEQTELTSAKAEVVELTEVVEESSNEADLALALSALGAALQSGAVYTDHVATIENISGVAVSKSISEAAPTGVKPLHQLQKDFPEAARLALKAALQADGGDGAAANFTAFVKSQIGVRTLQERAGDDPDAILSQAEAALARGQLQSAIGLLKNLPQDGVDALQYWLSDAQVRLDAEVEFKRLAQSLAPDN